MSLQKDDKECIRCGYIASSIENLIKHIKEEKMCPPLNSSIPHVELLNKIKPPLDLTCKYCKLLCKNKSSQTTHMKYYCHLNPNRIDRKKQSNKDTQEHASTSYHKSIECNRKYIPKNTSQTKGLFPFDKDLDWTSTSISTKDILDYVSNLAQGIIDLFIDLHSQENHKNIEWIDNKLVIYDGKGWTEVDDGLLAKHLGFLFSYLEEYWCDYQMDVRCGIKSDVFNDEITKKIDYFMYEQIVDDDSLLFYCRELLNEYLETLKSV